MSYNTYWGDSHCNIHGKHIAELPRTYDAARANLDFLPIAYYPADYYQMMEGLRVESHGPRKRFERDWQQVLDMVRDHNTPGEFVTFPGYEWTGNRTRYGDYNVFYCADGGPLDLSWDLPDVFANLRRAQAIAIPHHPGYQVGWRGMDWGFYDEDLSPFVELYSSHGSSEGCNTPFTLNGNGAMSPRVSGGTVQDGLARGYRLGIVASSDSHTGVAGPWGSGLMGVLANELTRESLWEAFKARRVYAVTGDRIHVDFTINGHPMGSVIETNGRQAIRVAVRASQALDRVELLRNNRVIRTHCHSGSWEVPEGDRSTRAKLKIECGWGPDRLQPNLAAGPKQWLGGISLSEGRLLSVEPCFTHWGQSVGPLEQRTCQWQLTTARRKFAATGPSQQGLIFEIEVPPEAPITIKVDGREETLSLHQAMAGSRVIALVDEMESLVHERFRIRSDELENCDVLYHSAYKVKLYTAIPEAGYTATCEWEEDELRPGRNWYYVRVTQLNGQMAWSSPIWVESG